MHSPRQECNRVRQEVKFIFPRSRERLSPQEDECYVMKLFMKFWSDSSNRTANIEPFSAAAFGQQTRCHRSGTSGSQILSFHTHEGYSKKAQILQNSYSRAPLVTERRRTRIPARALNTGVEPLQDSLFFKDLDFPLFQIRGPTHLKNQSLDGIRFRESINKVGRLAYLASCLANFSGDPPQHFKEDAKALTSRFNDLLHSRRLSEARAACGDPLGKLQQHGAILGNNYSGHLLIASTLKLILPILSNHLSATLSCLEFLEDRCDAMTSSKSLQFPLGYLVATPWHREKGPVGHHNALAHFEGILQSLMDGMDGKTPVESIPQILEEKTRPWIVDLGENQIISLLEGDLIHHLVDYRQASWLRSERLRVFFLWKSRDMVSVRAVDLESYSPHHIHSAGTVLTTVSLVAQGTCFKTSKS